MLQWYSGDIRAAIPHEMPRRPARVIGGLRSDLTPPILFLESKAILTFLYVAVYQSGHLVIEREIEEIDNEEACKHTEKRKQGLQVNQRRSEGEVQRGEMELKETTIRELATDEEPKNRSSGQCARVLVGNFSNQCSSKVVPQTLNEDETTSRKQCNELRHGSTKADLRVVHSESEAQLYENLTFATRSEPVSREATTLVFRSYCYLD
ncbi:hypothetical protein B0H14DRAFT_2557463 [Mycena olivaceomarginata]|nr:hypothetical protein B0H14DRAFT_2557463 [Mycena olivaceomarginata]